LLFSRERRGGRRYEKKHMRERERDYYKTIKGMRKIARRRNKVGSEIYDQERRETKMQFGREKDSIE
jgi:hypothetical protein